MENIVRLWQWGTLFWTRADKRPVGFDIKLAVGESQFESMDYIQGTHNRLVVSFCEQGDGISGFVKGDEYLDCLKSKLY